MDNTSPTRVLCFSLYLCGILNILFIPFEGAAAAAGCYGVECHIVCA